MEKEEEKRRKQSSCSQRHTGEFAQGRPVLQREARTPRPAAAEEQVHSSNHGKLCLGLYPYHGSRVRALRHIGQSGSYAFLQCGVFSVQNTVY